MVFRVPDRAGLKTRRKEVNRSTFVTLAIPLAAAKSFPALPTAGIASRDDRLEIPGIRQINSGDVYAGNDPSIYVFAKQNFQGQSVSDTAALISVAQSTTMISLAHLFIGKSVASMQDRSLALIR
jgi:hypothetical protein